MAYTAPTPIRFEACAVKDETTYGTDPVPTVAANAIRLSSRVWVGIVPSLHFPNLRDEVMNQGLIPPAAGIATGQKVAVTARFELKGFGSDYTSAAVFADFAPFLNATGWLGVWSAAPDKWTHTPITSGGRPSCSMYGWGNGMLYKTSGIRGNITVTIRAGEEIQVNFVGEGLLTAYSAAAAPSATLTTVTPPVAIAGACTVGAWSPDYDEIVLASGNNCQWLLSGNAAQGLQSYDYGESKPTLTLRGAAVPMGTYDPLGDWIAATARAFSLSFGTVQYNRGTITDTGLWIPREPQPSNRQGFTGWTVQYRCSAPALLLN
jgi:hypothetical protein